MNQKQLESIQLDSFINMLIDLAPLFIGMIILSSISLYVYNKFSKEINLRENEEWGDFFKNKENLEISIDNLGTVEIEFEKTRSGLLNNTADFKTIKLNLIKTQDKRILDVTGQPRFIGEKLTVDALKKDHVTYVELIKYFSIMDGSWNLVRNGKLDIDYIILPKK